MLKGGGSAVQNVFDCTHPRARGLQHMCAKRQKGGSVEPKEPLDLPLSQCTDENMGVVCIALVGDTCKNCTHFQHLGEPL